MAICKFCKHVSADGTPFCGACGARLDPDAVPKPNPLTQQPPVIPPVPTSVPTSSSTIPQSPDPSYQQGTYGTGTPAQPGMSQQGPNSQKFEPANTIPFNDRDREEYAERLADPGRSDHDTVCVLALVFAMLSILFNPLLINSVLAIILGIIGIATDGPKRRIARLALFMGLITLIIYAIIAYVIHALTFGLIWMIIKLFV